MNTLPHLDNPGQVSFSEDDCTEYQESAARPSRLFLAGAFNVQNGIKQGQWVACIGCVDGARPWVNVR
jgi:hypothetical protein